MAILKPEKVEFKHWPRDPNVLVANYGEIFDRANELIKCPPDRDGYLFPYIKGLKTRVFLHVIVCETFHGPRPEGMQVAHENGIKIDCSAKNLSWKTCSENQLDKRRHGTDMIGERNGRHKLTEDEVRIIRDSEGVSARVLARRFDVSRAAIRFVLDGTTWKHVI